MLESVVTLSRELTAPRQTPFGDTVLTRTQLDILFVIAHAQEPVTPGHLAATLRVTPGAITQTVEQLRRGGLVEQSISDKDGRARVLALTESSRDDVEAFEAAAVARLSPLFAALSNEELAVLVSTLTKVGSSR